MPRLELQARAKLNLTLDVLDRRPDGYHNMRMIMQSVDLGDKITLETRPTGGLTVHTNMKFLPNDERNLAAQAALRFAAQTGKRWDGLHINVQKNIPVCAGMAGGSSDAAAVLRGLNELTGAGLDAEALAGIGAGVGSDVPYCLMGGTALAEGRGERLTPLPPLPACHIVICKPRFPVATPKLFERLRGRKLRCRPDTDGARRALEEGDLPGVARRMYNVFEGVLQPRQEREVASIKHLLVNCGALGATMSGTGPTVFGLFNVEQQALAAAEALAVQYRDVFLTRPV
ncbi:MAG: 4-(cytidine 5'-diphospho)-2-C-methyl-D-erythritol kinase [Clostridiales bacterium]|nr:4-(cytidine 5'-diphospho)-2-C-methyl-D-erythritol kinase [Clostridiales bacterium]